MSTTRSKKAKHTPSSKNYSSLYVSLVIALGLFLYLFLTRPSPIIPQKADILVIDESSLSYGHSTLRGILQKDSQSGSKGQYYLTLFDTRVVLLDLQNQEDLLNQPVVVSGTLLPPEGTIPGYMQVTSIKLINPSK